MPLKEYDQIKLKDDIQDTLGDKDAIDADTNRTSGKDEVASYIVDEVVQQGRWPVDMTALADETGWSRQHVANTISHYFEGVDGGEINNHGDPANYSNPMSASPHEEKTQPTGNNSSTETSTTEETKTVFIRINNHIEEVDISVPQDLDDPRTAYVRGYMDGAENR